MTSQIPKRSAAPSQGLWAAVWKDWVAGAVLVVVWVALWTTFSAGVLTPAASLAARGPRAAQKLELTSASGAQRWVPAP
jgi:hypothetical protein